MHEALPLILQQVRRFGAGLDAAAIDAAACFPEGTLEVAADIGLFGLSVPEPYGGLGLDLGETGKVVAELARFDRSMAVTIGLHGGLGTQPLRTLGDEGLRRRWLPRLARGEAIASFCATEPGAGSDLKRVQTTAERDGDELVITGEKSYVTNGAFAGLFTILARTPQHGGPGAISLLVVPRTTPGVSIGPEEHKLGIRGSSTVTVRFDGARVPVDHLLGRPGTGLGSAHRALAWGRTLLSAGCIGTARAALDATLRHVEARRQFGGPLLGLGAVQEHVAQMASDVFAMEALVDRAAELVRREHPSADSAAAMAKVFCSETAYDVCDRAIQLHGALGFIEDTGVSLLARDCRVTRIFEGANDVLLQHLGVGLVVSPTQPSVHPVDRSTAPGQAEGVEARLHETITMLRVSHGVSIVRQPHAVGRLARAHVAICAARAALERGQQLGGDAVLLADHAARRWARRASENLRAVLTAPEDAERDRAVIAVLSSVGRDERADARGPSAPRSHP